MRTAMTSAATRDLDSDSSRPRWKLNSKCAKCIPGADASLVSQPLPPASDCKSPDSPDGQQVFDARTTS